MKKNKKDSFGLLDYKKYKTAGDFYRVNIGKVPLMMMQGITRIQREENLTFQESFQVLLNNKRIILIK